MLDIREVVHNCVNYIETNINNKISLDDIADNSGISKYHLHRIFKSLTGETLIDYVQSRKLSSSINELVYTNKRIIDIALDYGFDYEQSYIRAFRKKFSHTPLKVRSEQLSLIIKEKLNINDIFSINNSIIYKPFFVFRPAFFLIGNKHKILYKSGDKAASSLGRIFFSSDRNKVENTVSPSVYYGYTDWQENDRGYIYYVPSVQVTDLRYIPKGMEGIAIAAHKYVVFRFVGFFRPEAINGRQVGRLLVNLYSRWIFKSGFKFADTFRFEYIDTGLAKDDYCELDIYQPVSSSDN